MSSPLRVHIPTLSFPIASSFVSSPSSSIADDATLHSFTCPIHHSQGANCHVSIPSLPDHVSGRKTWRRFVKLHWHHKSYPKARSYNDDVASCVIPFVATSSAPSIVSSRCKSLPEPPTNDGIPMTPPATAASSCFSGITLVNSGDRESCLSDHCASKRGAPVGFHCCDASTPKIYDPTSRCFRKCSPTPMPSSPSNSPPLSPLLDLCPAYISSPPTLAPIPHFALDIPGLYEEVNATPDPPGGLDLGRITADAARQARMRRRKFRLAYTASPHLPCEYPDGDEIPLVVARP
ncbi:hypothetical protein SCP_1300840 [Sparassis crispa]|uniref:Uncharacterized protein n=1 Tax=Sparassis crispa TaxID=139825 RepID=A0A401H1K1_9APHY|nr:hypothetical protein SCP_1300840 [Sparassis crispa]GBE88269.1 hypothetical protein SCP_1300840 [Sparassis crispa]